MLDERQFELIASESAGLVAIQGSAGSGKTTVGLHRVAYLAFREPQRFRPEKMFVVVPNEALVHYVGARAAVARRRGGAGDDVRALRVAAGGPALPALAHERRAKRRRRSSREPSRTRRCCGASSRLAARIGERCDARCARAIEPSGPAPIRPWPRGMRPPRRGRRLRTCASPSSPHGSPASGSSPGRRRRAALPAGDAQRARAAGRPTCAARLARRAGRVGRAPDVARAARPDVRAGAAAFGPAQLDQVHAWCVRQARVRAEAERDGEEPSLDAEDVALLLRCWQVLRGPLVDAEGQARSGSRTSSSTRCRTRAPSSCACSSS